MQIWIYEQVTLLPPSFRVRLCSTVITYIVLHKLHDHFFGKKKCSNFYVFTDFPVKYDLQQMVIWRAFFFVKLV